MGWLLELLIEGLREICSQFVIDMMDLVTGMFTELLSCDLTLFEELFSVVGDLYKNVMVPMGIAILLLIWIWQLFKSMFGKSGVNSEDPIELVCRSCIALFFVVAAKPMINYILNIAGTPYQWVVGTKIDVESFSEYVSVLEKVTGVLGIGSLNISILMLIMQFVVAWNYFKMLFIIAERYVLLGVFSYTAPLAFSTGGSKATNNILASWAKMFGGQIVLIILNAWCMKMFLSGYGNLMASSYGFTKFFVATLCLIGFCKITFKLDSYMASLGVNLGRPSYGLGAMGLMMAAGRILSHVGRGGSGAGGQTAPGGTDAGAGADGNGAMPDASAGPIPMSFGMDDEPIESMPQENGFGDEADTQADIDTQGDFVPENTEDAGVLEELGMMPTDLGTDENTDTGVDEDSGFSEESGMNLESGEVPEFQEGSELLGEGNEQGSGIPEAGFGDETNILGDMSDYPVEEDFDSEAAPEMDLEGGSIDSAGIDTEGVTYGSADSSYNNSGLSSGGNAGESTLGNAGTDVISEIGGETAVSGFDSYNAGGETVSGHSSDGHTFDAKTSDGMPVPGTPQTSMEPEFENGMVPDYEIMDEERGMEAETRAESHMNHLDIGRSIPSAEGKFQKAGTKNGKRSFREVPKSREELRRRKQGNQNPDSKDSRHKN